MSSLSNLSDPKAAAYHDVQERIMRQTLEALWFDGILNRSETNRVWRTDGVGRDGKPVAYTCEAEEKYSFGRVKIVKGSIQRENEPCTDLYLFLEELVLGNLQGERIASFIQELLETLAKDNQCRAELPECIPDSDRHYDALESHMTDGHPYHPSYKSRLGFTLKDNLAYGPEFNRNIRLHWVAVKQELTDMALSAGCSAEEIYGKHLTENDRQRFGRILKEQGDGSAYVLIPVHPWQWEHQLETVFTRQRLCRELIPLGISDGNYRAQQSIRTLSHRDHAEAAYIKLSLSITNTSTSRILAHHTTQNAPLISDWLDGLIRQDELLQRERFGILKEVMGLSFRYEGLPRVQYRSAYGTLGAIWRENVSARLREGEEAWPLNALMLVQNNGEPFIRDVIGRHGIRRWSEALVRTLTLPMIHLLYAHGIALEAHAQNIILVLEDGLPVRIIVKDLHDGVRFVPDKLLFPELAPKLYPEPETHRRFNRYSFIHAKEVSEVRDYTYDAFFFICMTEIALTLERFGLPEREFWSLCTATIAEYQRQFPEYRERFKWFDLFAADALIEEMTKRRLYGDGELHFRKTSNPLRLARESLSLS
ncbi:IucA/IucC family siderophore biosynthesis protein [Paenibacillus oralis]|uniref:IucA/IucC family siderophore biosynthesis protein n=1 Tax=Paenibacillus oralis TaxID=2490856 RepID=A0A3P3U7N0_9BACL|nr:IucA/IucC family protein [Paenibacillus oralis]RRJ65716.1 IucA/IucC family siderophore biosynthesis protein [Paenibacillus oralis]